MPEYTVSLKLHVERHPWEPAVWIASHELLSWEAYGMGKTPEEAVAECQRRCDTKRRNDQLRRAVLSGAPDAQP